MARHWIRSRRMYDFTGVGDRAIAKQLVIFIEDVLGYTFQAKQETTGSWTSTEHGGTGGVFSGSDFVFTDAGGTFLQSDVTKWLFVKDTANPTNSGWYKITKFNSSTSINIDFRTQTFPLASTGITWKVFADNYQLMSETDYYRLQSPHVSGWAIEFSIGSSYNMVIRVAFDGNWSGSRICSCGTREDLYYINYGLAGLTDGTELLLWTTVADPPGQPYDVPTFGGCLVIIAEIDPVESGLAAHEKIGVATAVSASSAWSNQIKRDTSSTAATGRVYCWSDRHNAILECYMVDHTYAGNANSFTGWGSRECNRRAGYKVEAMIGTPFVSDVDNKSGQYNIRGIIKGHYTTMGFNGQFLQVLSTNGTDMDLYHLYDGLVVPWPNVAPEQ